MTYEQTMGELAMQVWAAGSESPPDVIPASRSPGRIRMSTGWGGDRLNMYEGPNGAWIIDWMTAWDTRRPTPISSGAHSTELSLERSRARPDRTSACAWSLNDPALIVNITSCLSPFCPWGYIESGAEIPRRPSALASVIRVASTSASRSADVSGSALSTTRRSR